MDLLLQNPSEVTATRDKQLTVREALSSKREEPRKQSDTDFPDAPDYSDEDEANFDARMRQQILLKRKELGILPTKPKLPKGTFIFCKELKSLVYNFSFSMSTDIVNLYCSNQI